MSSFLYDFVRASTVNDRVTTTASCLITLLPPIALCLFPTLSQRTILEQSPMLRFLHGDPQWLPQLPQTNSQRKAHLFPSLGRGPARFTANPRSVAAHHAFLLDTCRAHFLPGSGHRLDIVFSQCPSLPPPYRTANAAPTQHVSALFSFATFCASSRLVGFVCCLCPLLKRKPYGGRSIFSLLLPLVPG